MKLFALLTILLMQEGGQVRLQTGTVRGEIRGLEGLPAAGVRVSAVPDRSMNAATALDMMIVLSQTDASGRYTLEGIPPGRYVITAGLIDSPTYYPGVNSLESARIVSVAAAETVSSIDFTLARSAGVRVSGSVKGFPAGAPAGVLRVTLTGPGAPGGRLPESQVRTDGTFEFQRVPPGTYNIRLTPALPGQPTRIDVQNKDIDSITLDAGILIPGKLVVNDGGPLPQTKLLSGVPDLPALVRLSAQSLNTSARAGSVVSPVRASDGAFIAMLSEEEYRIVPIGMALGYTIQSISHDGVDLLQSPLKVTKELSSRPGEIRVTLATAPPSNGPAWRKITGRVFGVPAGNAAQYLVLVENAAMPLSATGSIQRMGQATLRDDGTFEIPNVPPDSYSLRVVNPTSGGMPGASIGIVVAETDVTGVELFAAEPRTMSSALPSPPPTGGAFFDLLQRGTLPSTEPAGVRVAGNVTLASINDSTLMPHTAVLFGAKSGARTFHTPISSNGTFEFPNVPPGEYDMRTLPLTLPNESTRLLIDMQELRGLRVALPPQSDLRGRLRLEDGKSLPDGATLKLVSPLMEIAIPIGVDGGFAVRVAHGEYKLSIGNVPQGYDVTPGTINVSAPGTTDIAISLKGVTP